MDTGSGWTEARGSTDIQNNKAELDIVASSEAMSHADPVGVPSTIEVTGGTDALPTGGVGIAFRVQDSNNFFEHDFSEDPGGGNLLFEVNGGVFTLRGDGGGSASINTFYSLKTLLAADNIKCSVNGSLDAIYTSSSMIDEAKCGLYGWDGAPVTWDDFCVTL